MAGGGWGAGVRVGPTQSPRVIIWPRPGPPRRLPGLWLLRAESGVSLWVLSWAPLGRGCHRARPGPVKRLGVGALRAGPGARVRGSLCGTGTGCGGTRWNCARWRQGGPDCAGLGAWCWLGLALGPGPGQGAAWDGSRQKWPTLEASAAGACGRRGESRDIFRITLSPRVLYPQSWLRPDTEIN